MVHSSLNAHWYVYYRTLWQSRFCISHVHLANKQALQAVIWTASQYINFLFYFMGIC